MDERVVEGFDKYQTTIRGTSISIVVKNPFGFFHAKSDKGNLPDHLNAAFTNTKDLDKAITKYVSELWSLRGNGVDKEPPVLKLKPVGRRKNGKTASK